MRTITRRLLAAGAVAGLLALPAASAGAAQSGGTTGTVELAGATGGTLAITVPTADATAPVDFGSTEIATAGKYETNGLGEVTVSDTRTGLIRTITVTTGNGLDDATASFCQDADGDVTGGTVACSGDAGDTIPLANSLYKFNSPTTDDPATSAVSVNADLTNTGAPLGTASASWVVSAGTFEVDWTPTFDITLLGTENAGTFYGAVNHSVSSAS